VNQIIAFLEVFSGNEKEGSQHEERHSHQVAGSALLDHLAALDTININSLNRLKSGKIAGVQGDDIYGIPPSGKRFAVPLDTEVAVIEGIANNSCSHNSQSKHNLQSCSMLEWTGFVGDAHGPGECRDPLAPSLGCLPVHDGGRRSVAVCSSYPHSSGGRPLVLNCDRRNYKSICIKYLEAPRLF
jgi:hypothetical protein